MLHAQTVDTIKSEMMPNGKTCFRYKDSLISNAWINDRVQKDSMANVHWKRYKRNTKASTIFSFTSGFALGDFIGELAFNNRIYLLDIPICLLSWLIANLSNNYRKVEFYNTIASLNRYLIRKG